MYINKIIVSVRNFVKWTGKTFLSHLTQHTGIYHTADVLSKLNNYSGIIYVI